MADLKIYNNGENKILMSAGDRIIRQPYDFSLGYKNALTSNHYINITGLNLTDVYSYLCIRDCSSVRTTNYNSSFSLINSSLQKSDVNDDRANNLVIGTMESTSYLILTISGLRVTYRGYDNGFTTYINNNLAARTQDFSLTPIGGVKDRLVIGAGTRWGQNNATIIKGFDTVFNRFVIFNRLLSSQEVSFAFNNALFSELQLTEGLIHDWNFSRGFELLSLDGVNNLVGVYDEVGGRHGIVNALPAGTPEEQLDYANANLIVRGIS